MNDTDTAAVDESAPVYEPIVDTSPTEARVTLDLDALAAEQVNTMPAVEAFAHAIAAQAHQHAGATPEDAPAKPARLPFPRPPFDVEKHLRRLSEKSAEIRELTVLVLRADEDAKRAAKAKQTAHESLETAHEEMNELVTVMLDEHQAEADGPAEQLALHEPGRTPCAWERDHPGEVCGICSNGGAHETVSDVVDAVADVVAAVVDAETVAS